jgi:hypothetical protein
MVTMTLVLLYWNNVYLTYYKEMIHGIVAIVFSLIYLYSRVFDNMSFPDLSAGIESTNVKYSPIIKPKSEYGPNYMAGSEDENYIILIEKISRYLSDLEKYPQDEISEYINEIKELDIEINKEKTESADLVDKTDKEGDNIKKNISVTELEDEDKHEGDKNKWLDGLNAYLRRWGTEQEIFKSNMKEEKAESIRLEVNDNDKDYSKIKEDNKEKSDFESKIQYLKPILKYSEKSKDNIIDSFSTNESIILKNKGSETVKATENLDKLNKKKEHILKKTMTSIRDIFHPSSKSKSDHNVKSTLGLNRKESKSFISKIKPKLFQSGSKYIEEEITLGSKSVYTEKKKVKWMLDLVNLNHNCDSPLDLEEEEKVIKREYLISSYLNQDKYKNIRESINETVLKDIKPDWKHYLGSLESSIFSKCSKEWILAEAMRTKNPYFIPIKELDLLIVPNIKYKPVITSDGRLEFVRKEAIIPVNSLKIKLFNLIEKHPMGLKEALKKEPKELLPISIVDLAHLKHSSEYKYNDKLFRYEKEELPFLWPLPGNELKHKYKLNNRLSNVLLKKDFSYIEKLGWKKERELLTKLFDTNISLKEPWSEVLAMDKQNELGKVKDNILPYFKRLTPLTFEEYLNICNEIGYFKEKSEQIISWNEWALYQILETHNRKNDIITRDFVWFNKDYLPFNGPLSNNTEWINYVKKEFESIKEIRDAQEILSYRKLPISWEVIQDQNLLWEDEYKLFKKNYKVKIEELKDKLFNHLINSYNLDRKEWLRVYDLSRRIMNDTYNLDMGGKYDEIEEYFYKEYGYSYRERMWEYDKYLAKGNQNWIGSGKEKSSEFKKRIIELESKWKNSSNKVEKLKQDELLNKEINKEVKVKIDLNKGNILPDIKEDNLGPSLSKEKNSQIELDLKKKRDISSNILELKKSTEDLEFILANKLELKGKSKLKEVSNYSINTEKYKRNKETSELFNDLGFNQMVPYDSDFKNKGKDPEVKVYKDKGKSPEIQISHHETNDLLNVKDFIHEDQLYDWLKTDEYLSNYNNKSTIPDDQIIPESSKDAEKRAQNYINFLKEEKMREKMHNIVGDSIEATSIKSNIFDPDIIASRRNKPLTIRNNNQLQLKESNLEVSKPKINTEDNIFEYKKEDDKLELDKNKKRKSHWTLMEEKKSKLELEKATLRKERKTHLAEVLNRGKEIPVYKYRGDDRFLDSDSEESVHEQGLNLYPKGHFLDPNTGKIISEPKIVHDSYGSTILSPALPDPMYKPKMHTFLPPGHEWGMSSPIPSDFILLSDPKYITNSQYGPYGSERFIRNLLFNKEVSRYVDTDYRDGFISVWKNNDVTQCTYALLDQRIPKMIREDINKQNFDMDNSRARFLDNDQEWDITQKIDKNKEEIIQKKDIVDSVQKFRERKGEPRETVFIREGNTYLVAHRNIEVDKKALDYLNKAVINMFGEAHGNIVRPDVNMWAAWVNSVNTRQISTRNQVLEFLRGRDWSKMNFIEALQYGTLDVYIRAERFGEINLEVSRDDQHATRGNQAAKDYVIRISTVKLIRDEEMSLWKDNLKKLEKIGMPDEIESLKERIATVERTHEKVRYGLIRNNFIKERHLILPEESHKGNKPYSW